MKLPDFSYEKLAWENRYSLVIGVDEVGRGSFAGPVVAGAAAVKNIKYQKSKIKNILETISKLGINDSKKLSPHKRKELVIEIKKYFYWGIGEASVSEINRLGIVKATEKAMRKAVNSIKYLVASSLIKKNKNLPATDYLLPTTNYFLLTDAFHIKHVNGIGLKNQLAIVKGDSKSISIAAASILAKVYRDTLMQKLSLSYSKYQWGRNKGYGTEKHRQKILEYGTVRFHRVKYIETWIRNSL